MIGIINYGLGNIRAFANIYHELGVSYRLVSDPEELAQLTHIILPGVGSFDSAMEALENYDLIDALHHAVCELKIPTLGVCVGMQIMAQRSDEGEKKGLGWFDARVIKMVSKPKSPIPHMGWNRVRQLKPATLFNDIDQDSEFYFLHSYAFEADHDDVIATAEYSQDIGVILQSQHIIGVQCHPEKSHSAGIKLLENFAKLY